MRLIDHKNRVYVPPPISPRLRTLDPPRRIWRTFAWILLGCAAITGAIWFRLS